MDEYLLSSITGRRVLNIAKYSELLDQFTSELDYGKIFKPDVIYDARVLEQQGKQAKLNINGWILTAESLVDEKLSPQILLKFVPGDQNMLSFRLVRNGPAPAAGASSAEPARFDMAGQLRELMPGAGNEQVQAFIKALPGLEGDLFRNMVAFHYLYKLDEAKVADAASRLSGRLSIDLGAFVRELEDLAQLVNRAAGQVPAGGGQAPAQGLKDLLSRLGTIMNAMEKKIETAGQFQVFTDHESVEFKKTLSAIAAGISSPAGDDTPAYGEGVKTPGFSGKEHARQKQHNTGDECARGSPDSMNLPPAGSGTRHKIEGGRDAAPWRSRELPLPYERSGEISGRSGAGVGESTIAGDLKELVSRRLSPEKLVESAFRQAENPWQTTFALGTMALPASILREFRVEERAHRPDRDESREYQVTLEFSFKRIGQVKTILFWMDNVLSCRMICRDPAAYVLLQSSREELRERLKSCDIPVNTLKIEPAEV